MHPVASKPPRCKGRTSGKSSNISPGSLACLLAEALQAFSFLFFGFCEEAPRGKRARNCDRKVVSLFTPFGDCCRGKEGRKEGKRRGAGRVIGDRREVIQEIFVYSFVAAKRGRTSLCASGFVTRFWKKGGHRSLEEVEAEVCSRHSDAS